MNMNKVIVIVSTIAAVAITVAGLTGCSGKEVGGKFGVYRVDEKSDHSRTYRKNVPLACYLWKNCSEQPADESAGS